MLVSFVRKTVVLVMMLWAATISRGAENATATAEVRMIGGAPAFCIDGKPHCGLSYMTYANNFTTAKGTPALPQYVKLFADAGCKLYTFVVDLGGLYRYTDTVWPERERWDFQQVDAIAHLIVGAAPPDAKLIVQLYVDVPEWWAKENPDECFQLSSGSRDFGGKLFALPRSGNLPSIASTKWRDAARRIIETTIDHVQGSDYGSRVIGYQVCGQKTEEWYHWSMNTEPLGDYSPPMLAEFRRWLAVRYGDDARLQTAWHQPGASLATAAIPDEKSRYGDRQATFRDPAREQHVLDFHRFWSDVMADTIAYFARVVKDKTSRQKVVGAFYAYTFEFAELGEDAGHLALGRLLECPDLDFIMAPSSYFRRDLKGGQSCFRPPVRSLTLHGKLFWNDFDPASFKFYEKDQKEFAQWKPWLAVTDTADEYRWMIRRELGNALANGVNMAHFDHHGGYYDDPQLVDEVRKSREIREQALQKDRRSRAQILLVIDEDSQHYLSFRNAISTPLLSGQLAEMPFVAPFDCVLLSDLDRLDMSEYRLVLFVNAFKLDDAERKSLLRIKGDGRTIVWLYAPGLFRASDGPADPGGIDETTGIRVVRAARPAPGVSAQFVGPGRDGFPKVPLLNGDQFSIDDSSCEVLATRADDSRSAVIAARNLDGWTSIYSAVAPLPRDFLRDAARRAGVHLFHDDAQDAVYANREYFTLAAGPSSGGRTIHLRDKATVQDLAAGGVIASDSLEFTVTMKPHEVRIFSLNAER
jgi:hypothetical protein